MATIGQTLKAAREARGVTEHDAGTATKILTKMITAMEADDFSGMAAPAYAKGFIRLYARYLELDPEPLVEEYMLRYHSEAGSSVSGKTEPSEKNRGGSPGISFKLFHFLTAGGRAKKVSGKFLSKLRRRLSEIPLHDIRLAAAAAAFFLILVVLSVSISNCARRQNAAVPVQNPPSEEEGRFLLDNLPQDLYLVESSRIESSR